MIGLSLVALHRQAAVTGAPSSAGDRPGAVAGDQLVGLLGAPGAGSYSYS